MASCVRNIRAKNYQNLLIYFQVTVENVGDVFWGHSVHVDFRNAENQCSLKSAFNYVVSLSHMLCELKTVPHLYCLYFLLYVIGFSNFFHWCILVDS